MAVELISAKMIAPFYGNSLYVWTAVLALTLGGLTTGYFLGGWLSEKFSSKKTLFFILSIGAFLIGVMPYLSTMVMEATLSLNLKTGIVISCLVFLLPPLTCLGIVSPLIIRLVSTELKTVGKFAGTVYAISTAGGITFTFFTAFYLIPVLGLKIASLITALVILIFPLIFFMKEVTRRPAVSRI